MTVQRYNSIEWGGLWGELLELSLTQCVYSHVIVIWVFRWRRPCDFDIRVSHDHMIAISDVSCWRPTKSVRKLPGNQKSLPLQPLFGSLASPLTLLAWDSNLFLLKDCADLGLWQQPDLLGFLSLSNGFTWHYTLQSYCLETEISTPNCHHNLRTTSTRSHHLYNDIIMYVMPPAYSLCIFIAVVVL